MSEGSLAALTKRIGALSSFLLSKEMAEAIVGGLVADGATLSYVLGGVPPRYVDVRVVAADAHAQGAVLVVDNSISTSFGCPAARLGADVVVESLDRLGLGITAVSLSWSCPQTVAEAVRARAGRCHPMPGIEDAMLAWDVTRRHRNDAAQVVAAYLSCHPCVEEVAYPGLTASPEHMSAASGLVGGFGPRVGYRVCGSADWLVHNADDRDAREQVLALEARLCQRGR